MGKRKGDETNIPFLPIPKDSANRIYTDYFSDELEYCLFILKAKLYRRDALSVLDLTKKIVIDSNRMEGVKRGFKNEC